MGSKPDLSKEILDTYVHTYLREEIQAEGLSHDLPGFARFLDLAGANFSEIISYSNIGRESQTSPKTAQGYYDILEDTLIGFRHLAWEKSVRKRIVAHPKFYFFDNGVTNSLNRQLASLPPNPLMGKLFEQWLLGEVRAFLHYSKSDIRMYYWRTSHGAEVDLVLELREKIIAAIEIKYTSVVESKHLSGLRSLKEEYPKTPLYVVSDVTDSYELNGIPIYPWQEFLEEILPKWLIT